VIDEAELLRVNRVLRGSKVIPQEIVGAAVAPLLLAMPCEVVIGVSELLLLLDTIQGDLRMVMLVHGCWFHYDRHIKISKRRAPQFSQRPITGNSGTRLT
jgi:hypothetical protein